jgi:hypothetical protein
MEAIAAAARDLRLNETEVALLRERMGYSSRWEAFKDVTRARLVATLGRAQAKDLLDYIRAARGKDEGSDAALAERLTWQRIADAAR